MVSTSGSEHPIVTLPTRGSGVQAQIFLYIGHYHNLPVYRSTSQITCIQVNITTYLCKGRFRRDLQPIGLMPQGQEHAWSVLWGVWDRYRERGEFCFSCTIIMLYVLKYLCHPRWATTANCCWTKRSSSSRRTSRLRRSSSTGRRTPLTDLGIPRPASTGPALG